jgi:hypothetical protein
MAIATNVQEEEGDEELQVAKPWSPHSSSKTSLKVWGWENNNNNNKLY